MKTQLGDSKNTTHLYDLEVCPPCPAGIVDYVRIEVHANTRTQAASIAKEAGYVVYSVNMVG